jgi:AAA domain-containing protein
MSSTSAALTMADFERIPDSAYAEDLGSSEAKKATSEAQTRSCANSLPLLAMLWFATLKEVIRQEHLVKNLLLPESLFMIFGESNSGKTFLSLDLVLAIAQGAPWRGRPTRQGLVIYVAGESAGSVRNRVAAYRAANPDIAGGLPFAIIPVAVDFLDRDAITLLIATIKAAESECGEKIALICIDTFARALPGADENSSQDVGAAIAAADRIRMETGACVGFVHHSGKDPAKGARGSSALRAAVDTEIMVEGTAGIRTATVTKQRDLENGESFAFELVPVQIDIDPYDASPTYSCVVRHIDPETVAANRAATPQFRGRAQRQLLEALRVNYKTNPDRVWTLGELRALGRSIGQAKTTANSAVDVLVLSPFFRAQVGGYRFTDGTDEV